MAHVSCDCCGRREFIKSTAGAILTAGAASTLPAGRAWAAPKAEEAIAASTPESFVKLLFESLSPGQREKMCFPWEHTDERGLLRQHVDANWEITDEFVHSDFYTKDQQALVRKIFEGIIHPEWHERFDQQLLDDAGGFGEANSIAIFGEPGSEKFAFVMSGRHMTLRCDGNSADHLAFGGPIFYGHAAQGFDEAPDHPGNVFWPQAVAANDLYKALDGKQQELALVKKGMPGESDVAFKGQSDKFLGIPVTELSSDQREHLQQVLQKLIEPYRQSDRDEVVQCLKTQGGLDQCRLAFFEQEDVGADKTWDNWRLEGPAFVWHWRGAPHVHVWVNISDDPSVKTYAG